MGIFISKKNMLRCPQCGRYGDKTDGDTTCFFCGCNLVTQDEYSSTGYHHSNKPVVECPYCHSTDTKKITNTSKAVHTAVFGIFSMSRNSKQWHCNKCGSDF